jgi:hypothetical protein
MLRTHTGQLFPTCGCHLITPIGGKQWTHEQTLKIGLTKRELFAAMAMQGLLSAPIYDSTPEGYAHDAVLYADALLAELAKEKQQ